MIRTSKPTLMDKFTFIRFDYADISFIFIINYNVKYIRT